jgi:uridine monophosphate synthetase
MSRIPFFEAVSARIATTGSLVCVGLDPRLPDTVSKDGVHAALLAHAERLLKATRDVACCFKPNLAFYERHGAEGWRALADIVGMLREAAPVIVDAKRGDIGSTATAYAEAVFDTLDADAVTVSAGLGPDGLVPFLARGDRGVFALLRTSNAGADLVQEALLATGLPHWRGQLDWLEGLRLSHPNLGYVVGATVPMALLEVRRLAPDAWLLAPGVGAQGADAARTARIGANATGRGLIVPISRAIDESVDPAAAARALASELSLIRRETPNEGSNTNDGIMAEDGRDALVRALVAAGCVRFGTFRLKSGLESPVYLDLRRLVARPAALATVAMWMARAIDGCSYDHLAALPYAALPIGTAMALHNGDSLIYPRRERKGYGTDVAIEGVFEQGDTVLVVDDVVTRGDAKLEALTTLRGAGLEVRDMVVLVDREEGAEALLATHGTRLHAVLTLADLARRARRLGLISADDEARTLAFIARPREAGAS